jgi:glycosyltransferase involved in cell wall biosynthesis
MSKVSVIIPTYNRSEIVCDAIQSVLAQTHRDVEVIVVDDGSTDDTEAVVASTAGVRYEKIAHGGASAARNRGIAEASGSYLLFLDSDDVLLPTAIEKLSGALDEHPEHGAAYCAWILTSGPNEVVDRSSLDRPSGNVLREMCVDHLVIVHSVMVRRECLEKSGLFDTALSSFEDIDLWIRVAEHCSFVFVPEHLVEYRRWGSGASQLSPRLRQDSDVVLGKLAQYRRSGVLSPSDWRAVRYRFWGSYRNLYRARFTAVAFEAFSAGQWRKAYRHALRGVLHNPRSILNKGVWAVLVKSFARSLWGTRSQ